MADIKNPLGLAAILGGGSALLQGIVGAVQTARGAKGFNRTMANRPDYEIPQEYKDILARYQQAQSGNMPGYEQTLGQIGQAGARARGAAERGAISSAAYGSQVGDIYQKELDAIQNLGVQQAEYKTNMLDSVSRAQGQMGQQKAEQWNINKYVPWQTEMNRYGEMKQAGMNNLFGGIQSGVGNLMDLAGTKYYSDSLKAMQGITGNSGIFASKEGNFFQSPALGGQSNLLETTKKLLMGTQINFPE